MDSTNTFKQHFIVGLFSLVLVFVMGNFMGTPWPAAFARTSFFLLFLTLFVGPFMRLRKPAQVASPLQIPSTWRGELGIWFTLTGLMHFVLLAVDRPITSFIEIGGGGYGLANLLGLVALLFALILAATSCSAAIKYLGVQSWKWIQSFSYVIFYLVVGHILYFQFFSTYENNEPDWFGYAMLILSLIIIFMQSAAFIATLMKKKKKA